MPAGSLDTIEAFIERWRPSGGAERANYQLHDDLDLAVLDAYGWSDLHLQPTAPAAVAAADTEQELLQRLVDLNHARAAEEATGQIRYRRPDYQAPAAATPPTATPQDLDLDDAPAPPSPLPATAALKLEWPTRLPDQINAIRQALTAHPGPTDAPTIARHFGRATPKRTDAVTDILDTLVLMGAATQEGGGYVGK